MFCHQCGIRMPDGSRFCRMCGTALIRQVPTGSTPTRDSTTASLPSPVAAATRTAERYLPGLPQPTIQGSQSATSNARGVWRKRRRHRPWYRKLYTRMVPTGQALLNILAAVLVILVIVAVIVLLTTAGR